MVAEMKAAQINVDQETGEQHNYNVTKGSTHAYNL